MDKETAEHIEKLYEEIARMKIILLKISSNEGDGKVAKLIKESTGL